MAVEMAGALGNAFLTGPALVQQTGVDLIMLSMSLADVSAPGTSLSSLGTAFGRSFTTQYNDVGSGSFSIANLDSTGAADADLALLELGQLVTFSVLDIDAITIVIESLTRVSVSQDEEHGQITTVTGRSHLCLWEEAVIWPVRGVDQQPIEEDRVFNFTSPIYDDSTWGTATEIATVADAQVNWALTPFCVGFPSPTTQVIWDASGDETDAPVGLCYFRKTFTVAADGWYTMTANSDNLGHVWLDGQKFIDMVSGFDRVYDFRVFLSAGDHLIACDVENTFDDGPVGGNPAGLVLVIYSTTATGELDTVILETDASWKILPYPDHAPGMTPGQVIRVILEEAQARGVDVMTGMTLQFDDVYDTAGVEWPEVADIATKVGTNYLTFLKEMCVAYIDVYMHPRELNLYAWSRTGMGVNRATVLAPVSNPNDPTSGNMLSLSHTISV